MDYFGFGFAELVIFAIFFGGFCAGRGSARDDIKKCIKYRATLKQCLEDLK